MSSAGKWSVVRRFGSWIVLAVLAALLCTVRGVSEPVLAPATQDLSADAAFLVEAGILQGFPSSWCAQDGPVSKEEVVVVAARVHSYVVLRVAKGNMSEPLDRPLQRLYSLRPKGAGPVYGIGPESWAYPAALYLRWVDGVAPGRAQEVLSLAGRSRFECYAAARSSIERASQAHKEAQSDPVMQWGGQ